jgi:hypothetical protein
VSLCFSSRANLSLFWGWCPGLSADSMAFVLKEPAGLPGSQCGSYLCPGLFSDCFPLNGMVTWALLCVQGQDILTSPQGSHFFAGVSKMLE